MGKIYKTVDRELETRRDGFTLRIFNTEITATELNRASKDEVIALTMEYDFSNNPLMGYFASLVPHNLRIDIPLAGVGIIALIYEDYSVILEKLFIQTGCDLTYIGVLDNTLTLKDYLSLSEADIFIKFKEWEYEDYDIVQIGDELYKDCYSLDFNKKRYYVSKEALGVLVNLEDFFEDYDTFFEQLKPVDESSKTALAKYLMFSDSLNLIIESLDEEGNAKFGIK